jgi:hypothetical protein
MPFTRHCNGLKKYPIEPEILARYRKSPLDKATRQVKSKSLPLHNALYSNGYSEMTFSPFSLYREHE